MYLAQTNLVIDENKIATHKDGGSVLVITSDSQPDEFWFVRKNQYADLGRDCNVFKGIIDKRGFVDVFFPATKSVKFTELKSGNLFKDEESSSFYYVRGNLSRNLKNGYSCTAYRCKDHTRYSHADRPFYKNQVVHQYYPECDSREYRQ